MSLLLDTPSSARMIRWFEQRPSNASYRGPFWARLPPFPPRRQVPVSTITAVLMLAGAGAMVGSLFNELLSGDTTVGVSQALYINPAEFGAGDISPAARNSLITVSDDGSAYGLSLEVYGGDLYTIRLPISNRGRQDLVAELYLPWADQAPQNPVTVQVRGLYWFTDANHNRLYDYGEALVLTNDAILDSSDSVVKAGYAPFGNYSLGLYYADHDGDSNFSAGEAVIDQSTGSYANLLEPTDTVITAGTAALYKFSAVAVAPGKWRMLVPAAADPIEYQITLAFADNTPPGFYDLPGSIYPVEMSQGLEQLVEEPVGHNYQVNPGSPNVRLVGHDRAPDGNLVLRAAGTDFRLDMGSIARGQTITYTAALGLVNEGLAPGSITGITITGEGADYMRVWLHTQANRRAQSQLAPTHSQLIWNGSQGALPFTWELAAGNNDYSDMWSRTTPIYTPAQVRALPTPWGTDEASYSDHVWVQIEISIPQSATNGLYTGDLDFQYGA